MKWIVKSLPGSERHWSKYRWYLHLFHVKFTMLKTNSKVDKQKHINTTFYCIFQINDTYICISYLFRNPYCFIKIHNYFFSCSNDFWITILTTAVYVTIFVLLFVGYVIRGEMQQRFKRSVMSPQITRTI